MNASNLFSASQMTALCDRLFDVIASLSSIPSSEVAKEAYRLDKAERELAAAVERRANVEVAKLQIRALLAARQFRIDFNLPVSE